MRTRPFALVCSLATVAALADATDASAQTKEQCVEAHGSAQENRRAQKLIAARASLRECSASSCPAPVAKDCTSWLDEVDRTIPTLTFSARDRAGRDVADVEVSIDGVVLLARLDGKLTEVDPGTHTITFARGAWRRVDTVVVVAGERGRIVRVDVDDPPGETKERKAATPETPKPSPATEGGLSPLVLGLGGLAVAGMSVFTYFAISGSSDERTLARTCAPTCTDDDIHPVQRAYVIADVGLAVGFVSAAAAVWLGLRGQRAQRPPQLQ